MVDTDIADQMPHSNPSVERRLLCLVALGVPLACDRESSEYAGRTSAVSAQPSESVPLLAPLPSASAAPPVFEGTAGIVERGPRAQGMSRLHTVRAGRHDGFDRVVFELSGDALPGYHVEYVDKPVRKCGSGDPTAILGDGWLEVRLAPAEAHGDGGVPTVPDPLREQRTELPIVREIELTCDFEATVTWVLGTASPNPYRVLELRNPTRLVVDVRHEAGVRR